MSTHHSAPARSAALFTLLVLLFGLSGRLPAAEFLSPEQAFQFSHASDNAVLKLQWKIAEGYYLYQQRISAYTSDNPDHALPVRFLSQSHGKQDRNFGQVEVFYDEAKAEVDITTLPTTATTLTIEYQGCSKDGLCYNPEYVDITVTGGGKASGPSETPPTVSSPEPTSASGAKTKTTADAGASVSLSQLDDSSAVAQFLKTSGFWTTVGVFLLLGIGLSMTPCILPMVPILSGIIAGHGSRLTPLRGAALSFSYVLGMSIAYAIAGMLAATLGAQGNLQMYMQNPWVIGSFALVFIALALAMFGVYNLQLPSAIQNRLHSVSGNLQGGHFVGVFIMGALSALVVSPCVSAPLAGALVFISSTGNMLLGGMALFSLGLGMGLPLILIGAGGGKLVPSAGMWMIAVKNFFGVVLLGVAIWLSSRILPPQFTLLLWALLLIFYGVYTGALEAAQPGLPRLKKAASLAVLAYGFILLIGAAAGGSDPLKPLPNLLSAPSEIKTEGSERPLFTRIRSVVELEQALAQAQAAHQAVVLDLYADWCTACQDMEKQVFNQASVRAALGEFATLQLDLTEQSREAKALLDRFGLYGPPSLLFFDKAGGELSGTRIQGEMPASQFLEHIGRVNEEIRSSCRKTAVAC